MEELKFGGNDFYFKVVVEGSDALIEIGDYDEVSGTYDIEAWFLSKEEARLLRDWLTEYLE